MMIYRKLRSGSDTEGVVRIARILTIYSQILE